jgi:translation initiation factor IF-2
MVGDKLEVFEIVEVAKKLGKTLAEEEAELEKKGGADTDKEGENS